MGKSKKISRRDAIKYMGTTAVGLGLGLGTAGAFGSFSNSILGKHMKVLLVNGSPNREGCTFTALS